VDGKRRPATAPTAMAALRWGRLRIMWYAMEVLFYYL